MAGWGVTNLADPQIDVVGTSVSVDVAADDVIDDSDAVFWIAPQIYRGNKVCLALSASLVSLSLRLSACPSSSLCLFVCLSVCLCGLSVRLSVCHSLTLSLSVCLSVSMSVCVCGVTRL